MSKHDSEAICLCKACLSPSIVFTFSGATFRRQDGLWTQRAYGQRGFTWIPVRCNSVPFVRWSIERLRREAKRLGMPMFNKQSKLELIDNLMEAYV